MGCLTGDQYNALARVDRALGKMKIAGIGFENPIYSQIYRARGALLGRIGVRVPRSVSSLIRILGLSPGLLDLFFDVDYGWITAARESAGADPVYHVVPDETAHKIIKGELTHDDFQALKTPAVYLGE